MEGMTIRKAALACGGKLCGEGNPDVALQNAVIDSRAVQPGDLFAALRGKGGRTRLYCRRLRARRGLLSG